MQPNSAENPGLPQAQQEVQVLDDINEIVTVVDDVRPQVRPMGGGGGGGGANFRRDYFNMLGITGFPTSGGFGRPQAVQSARASAPASEMPK